MLVLSRRKQEQIVLEVDGRVIKICVVRVRGGKVRLGVEAPRDVVVHRDEVWNRVVEEEETQDRAGNTS